MTNADWNPIEISLQNILVENFTSSLADHPQEGIGNFNVISGFAFHYRKLKVLFKNFYYYNSRLYSQYTTLGIAGSPTDEVLLRNITFSNFTSISEIVKPVVIGTVDLLDVYFIDIHNIETAALNFVSQTNVILNNLNFINYTSSSIATYPAIIVVSNSETTLNINKINLK